MSKITKLTISQRLVKFFKQKILYKENIVLHLCTTLWLQIQIKNGQKFLLNFFDVWKIGT